MYSVRITLCSVSSDTKQLLSNALSEIQSFSELAGSNSNSIRNAATATLCLLLNTETQPNKGPVIEHVQVVGTQGRYLLFLSSNANPTVPTFVLMTAHRSIISPKSTHVVPASKIHVFRYTTEDSTYTTTTSASTSLGCGTRSLLQLLHGKSTCNREISRAMQPFLGASRPRHCTTASDTRSSSEKTRSTLAVCVTEPDGGARTGFLPVISEGLLAAQSALRSPYVVDADIIIAQNHDLCVKLMLYGAEFRLCLYHTEDLLSSHVARPVAIVTLSHKFHSLDCIVEEKHDDKFLGQVTGLLAIVQELLRRNVTATPIRFMGPNRTRDMYSGMNQTDISSVLSHLRLVSDNNHIARTLNRKYKARVVRYVDSSTLLVERTLTSASSLSDSLRDVASYDNDVTDIQNNFQLHHCNALRYASAHHNHTIQGLLNHGFGMDLQEITTAILSGIAFCHSCAYDQDPVKIDNDTGGVYIHVINGLDFSVDYTDDMTKILAQSVASFSTQDSSWSKVRHNLRDNEYHGHGGDLFMVECHVAPSGVCFFRRAATDMSHPGNLHGKFVGAAFVTPSLLTKYLFEDKDEGTTPLQPTANSNVIHSPHAMISVAMELASHDLLSPHAIIQNATETLLLINAMCVHNNVRKTGRNMKTYRLNRKCHKMLRQAWLHTNMFKAARICGGTGNTEFYHIYSHLSTLSLLPMDAVNFWMTMPYV